MAKVDIFSGAYVSSFCANTTDCPDSERLNGRRHQPIITNFGGNSEQVQGFAIGAEGNLVAAVQRFTQISGNSVQQIETIKLDPSPGATIAGQRDARTYLNFVSLGAMAVDANGSILQSGVTSAAEGADPQRVIFVTRLTPTLTGDTGFATGLGGGASATTLVDFPRAGTSTLLDHLNETLVLDAAGRIVVTGSPSTVRHARWMHGLHHALMWAASISSDNNGGSMKILSMLLLATLMLPAQVSAAGSPLFGRWSVDTARLAMPPEARPQKVTIEFVGVDADRLSMIVEVLDPKGVTLRAKGVTPLDGTATAVESNFEADTSATSMPTPDVLVVQLAKDGAPASTRIYAVNADGESMVETVTYFNGAGQPINRKNYFTRVH